ncbi:MAG: hypothetical protein BZY81_02250 [SAR202 cluster bacterium Io17-Chloro-G4]|nr:MAG: hypothetical protein BZY81_02250 [SAR202 cluster bacterium Io17-Chloro-G4]
MPESRHRRSRGQALSRRARSAGNLTSNRPKRKKTNKIYLIASALIAVLVIAGFALGGLTGGGHGGSSGSAATYVDGVGERQSIAPTRNHLPEGTQIEYESFPPTSGDHYPPTALERCGFYEDGLQDEVTVHHLEHGNIVVSYNLPDPAQVDQLRSAVGNIGLSNVWGITRSYDKIPPGQVALAAWGVLDTMNGVDGDRINEFFNTYAGSLGPETVPCR